MQQQQVCSGEVRCIIIIRRREEAFLVGQRPASIFANQNLDLPPQTAYKPMHARGTDGNGSTQGGPRARR